MLWYSKQNMRGHSKINQQAKNLYNFILKHPQVVQTQVANYCIKLSIEGQTETHLVKKSYCSYQSENHIITW